ncbi:MAG: type I restriction endonuclease subunit R [Stigonema ocellatum SAG 48.90 = DSM 106950]|nr:type I restriction endonuclease subunit R [Stigonema ocellatum SAG 48.90 = DSM 106950]
MTTNARTLTLSDLRHRFGVKLNADDSFFYQWLDQAPSLTELEQQGLERLKRNYEYLSQEELPLEEVVKLVVVSPLLDLAGFYQPPFLIKTEVGTTLEITDDPDNLPIQGKIDVLIVQDMLWVLVIESKPARLDVTAGIPQALIYLLSAPTEQSTPYGMVTNGREVLFLKLDRSITPPQYTRSMTYRLLESLQEREQILQGLRYIGALMQ